MVAMNVIALSFIIFIHFFIYFVDFWLHSA